MAAKLPAAHALGKRLVDDIDDPDAFATRLGRGLATLADPAYAAAQVVIAPGSTAVFGVRNPLMAAIATELRRPLREGSAASALWLAQRLAAEPRREARLFSLVALRRAITDDPERSWQLLRQMGRGATEWITIDSLAEVYAQGILAEPFRWAELEQLVYSADRWERRLVGSTVATIPFRLPRSERASLAGTPGLMLIKSLNGDPEPDVQKALAWALRSWTEVDLRGVIETLREETRRASANGDGQRAWVIRDALTAPLIGDDVRTEISAALAGLRRRPGAPATSVAAATAAAFMGVAEHAQQQRPGTSA